MNSRPLTQNVKHQLATTACPDETSTTEGN